MLLHSLFKFYKQGQSIQNVGQSLRSRSQSKKCWYPWKKILMWNIKALAPTILTLLTKLKFSKSSSNSKVKVTIVGTQVKHTSSRSHCSKVFRKVNIFIKVGQTPWSQGQNCWYPLKGLVTMNIHVKNQSYSTHCSNVISKVKVSKNGITRSRSHGKK